MANQTLAATVLAARLKNRRLPSVEVPQLKDQELNRALEGVKEHIRMYEGDSGAPKERFVTLSELENAGLITAEVKNKFAYIAEVLGTDIGPPANAPVSSTLILSGGGGGVNTLRELNDTAVDGVVTDDFLQYRDGKWRNFDLYDADIRITGVWTHADCLVMENAIPIYWEDQTLAKTRIPLLELTPVVDSGLGTFCYGVDVAADPLWTSVTALIPFEGADGDTTAEDLSLTDATVTFAGGTQIDTATAACGTGSLLMPGATGDYVELPANNDAYEIRGTSGSERDACVEFFVMWNGTDQGVAKTGPIVQYAADALTSKANWNVNMNTTEKLVFKCANVSAVDQTGFDVHSVTSTTTLVQDQWYHIAVVYESPLTINPPGGALYLYVDGVLEDSDTITGNPPRTANTDLPLRFANSLNSSTYCDYAQIDGFRITQNRMRYTANFTPPATIDSATDTFFVGDPGFPTELDGTRIGLKNNIGINWDNTAGANVELAIFTGEVLPQPTWTNVQYLADFDGTDEQLTYTTVDQNARVLTNSGTKLDDTQVKFGTTSAYFDGNNDAWTSNDNGGISDAMLNTDWCCEGWMYHETGTFARGGHLLCGAWASAANLRQFNIAIIPTGEIQFEWSTDGTSGNQMQAVSTGANVGTISTWHHIAVTYNEADQLLRMFANGVKVYEATSDGVMVDSSSNSGADFVVGRIIAFPQNDYPHKGWLDDVRVTIGETVYTESFTPPTAAHPIGSGGIPQGLASYILGDPGYPTELDGTYIGLKNSIGINWDNAAGSNVEHLNFVPKAPGDPYWASVTFLALCDGTDGQTVGVTSDDDTGYSIAFQGTSELDTAQKAFTDSVSSILFPGDSASFVVVSSSGAVGNFKAATDWTIEGMVYFNTDPTVNGDCLISKWGSAGSRAWVLRLENTDVLAFGYTTDGTNGVTGKSETWTPNTGQWYHYAVVLTGGNMYFFIDGVQLGTPTAFSATISDESVTDIHLGEFTGASVEQLDGWSENVRITEGVGRYTSNFTPPTASLPTQLGNPATGEFVVGDPGYATKIDGTTTTITGAAQLDTTLNVDGVSDFNANVDLNTGADLTIWDTTNTDNVVLSHDGTDFLMQGTNAAAFRIQPLSGEDSIVAVADGSAELYYNAIKRLGTNAGGLLDLFSDTSTDSENRYLQFLHQDGTLRGFLGQIGSAFAIRHSIFGGNFVVNTYTGAGSIKTNLSINPDGDSSFRANTNLDLRTNDGQFAAFFTGGGSAQLYHAGSSVLETLSLGLEITGDTNQAVLQLTEADGTLDNKKWRFVANSEQLTFSTIDDAEGSSANWLLVNRTGTVVDDVTIFGSYLQSSVIQSSQVRATDDTSSILLKGGSGDGADVTLYGTSHATRADEIDIVSAGVRFYDNLGTDYGQFDHDGTDFNTTFVSTTDWNISGITDLVFENDTSLTFLTNLAAKDGTRIYRASANALRIEYEGNAHVINGLTGDQVSWRNADTSVMELDHGSSILRLREAYSLVILDSTNLDSATFNHDGTDFNTTFAATTDWNISGITNISAPAVAGSFQRLTADGTGVRASAGLRVDAESAGAAGIYLQANGGGVDEDNWSIDALNTDSFRIATATDADAFGVAAFQINRTGTAIDSIELNGLTEIHQAGGGAADFQHWRDTTDATDLVMRYNGVDWELRSEIGGVGNRYMLFDQSTGQVELYTSGDSLRLKTTATGLRMYSATSTDAETRTFLYAHQDGTARAQTGHLGGESFYVRNQIHGGPVRIEAENTAAGTVRLGFFQDPDADTRVRGVTDVSLQPNNGNNGVVCRQSAEVELYYNNIEQASTRDGAFGVQRYLQNRTATTTEIEDITHAVNTSNGKIAGAQIYNSTTGLPLWADGNTDGATWSDATGTVAHTPV